MQSLRYSQGGIKQDLQLQGQQATSLVTYQVWCVTCTQLSNNFSKVLMCVIFITCQNFFFIVFKVDSWVLEIEAGQVQYTGYFM